MQIFVVQITPLMSLTLGKRVCLVFLEQCQQKSSAHVKFPLFLGSKLLMINPFQTSVVLKTHKDTLQAKLKKKKIQRRKIFRRPITKRQLRFLVATPRGQWAEVSAHFRSRVTSPEIRVSEWKVFKSTPKKKKSPVFLVCARDLMLGVSPPPGTVCRV